MNNADLMQIKLRSNQRHDTLLNLKNHHQQQMIASSKKPKKQRRLCKSGTRQLIKGFWEDVFFDLCLSLMLAPRLWLIVCITSIEALL
jgi:hypothetical protein